MEKLEDVLFYHGEGPSELHEAVLDRLEQYFGKYCRFSNIDFEVFPDKESDDRIPRFAKIEGKTVVFFQSFYSQELFYKSLELMWGIKKQYKAKKLIAVIPFMVFRRQDHEEKLAEICRLKMAIELLRTIGVDEIVVVSPHSKKMQQFCEEFGIKMHEVDPLPVFVSSLKTYIGSHEERVTCAPDEGACEKAVRVAKAMGCPMVLGLKERGFDNEARIKKSDQAAIDKIINENRIKYDFPDIYYLNSENVKGKIVIVTEDEASTCQTASKIGYHLQELGAKKTILVASNAVFTPGWRRKLFPEENPPYSRVVMSDTIPRTHSKKTGGKIHDDSVSGPVADTLYKVLTALD